MSFTPIRDGAFGTPAICELSESQQNTRAAQYKRLVDMLGEPHASEAVNALDQIGLPERVRTETCTALITSIEAGQRWATGEDAVRLEKCTVCDGSTYSPSARGKCRVCRGFGRRQTVCRGCAGKTWQERHHCHACGGSGQLDPVTQRALILRQHEEWWRSIVEKTEKRVPRFHTGDAVENTRTGGRGIIVGVHRDAPAGCDPDFVWYEMMPPGRTDGVTWTVAEVELRAENSHEAVGAVARALEPIEIGPEAPAPMPKTIALALLVAQKAIHEVPKDSDNIGDGYAYTNAETIIREARKALHSAGLFVMPESWRTIPGEPSRLEIDWLVIHESGEGWVVPPVSIPIVTEHGSEKRARDKAEASALTYCQSQFLRLLLQIPRIDRAIDVDARVDIGGGGRRGPRASSDPTLSVEQNALVSALTRAIATARSVKDLAGVTSRLAQATDLPEKVVMKINESLDHRSAALSRDQ